MRVPERRRGSFSLPAALLFGGAVTLAHADARAGCAAGPPGLISAPLQMPPNGTLSLVLSHPLWHSRQGATGPGRGAPLGSSAEDLPFVLSANGSAVPLKLVATRPLPRGLVLVELEPAAGWLAGAAYELRADVGTKHVYPPFTAVAGPDREPPTWGPQPATAIVVRPPPAEPTPPPYQEHCVSKGRGTQRTTECSVSVTTSSSSDHMTVTEPHVLLHLPEVHDDHGGVLLLEIRRDELTTWVKAQSEVALGLVSPCDSPNFPASPDKPYQLLVTPVDAAHNRGTTLRIPVTRGPRR